MQDDAGLPATKKRPAAPYDPASEIIRPCHLPQAVGLSTTTVWRERRDGRFPAAIKLSKSAIGWRRTDIQAWLSERARTGR